MSYIFDVPSFLKLLNLRVIVTEFMFFCHENMMSMANHALFELKSTRLTYFWFYFFI